MRIRVLVLLGAAALLAACQTAYYQGNQASPFFAVPPGSRLTLNQELTIPAHAVSIHIQNGRILRGAEVQQYYPFCKFELYTMSETARTVLPHEITVTRTVREETTHGASAGFGPLGFAQLGFGLGANLGEQSGPSLHAFSTRMDLRSEKQPDIFRLTCTQWDFPGPGRHVAFSEIRRTLDPLFALRLPWDGG